jgi:hypothetical protein
MQFSPCGGAGVTHPAPPRVDRNLAAIGSHALPAVEDDCHGVCFVRPLPARWRWRLMTRVHRTGSERGRINFLERDFRPGSTCAHPRVGRQAAKWRFPRVSGPMPTSPNAVAGGLEWQKSESTNQPSGLSFWLAAPGTVLRPTIATAVWRVMPADGSEYRVFLKQTFETRKSLISGPSAFVSELTGYETITHADGAGTTTER